MGKKRKQMSLPILEFRVTADDFPDLDFRTTAGSASQAKYRAYKAAREARWFDKGGFRRFLQCGFKASEVRSRPPPRPDKV